MPKDIIHIIGERPWVSGKEVNILSELKPEPGRPQHSLMPLLLYKQYVHFEDNGFEACGEISEHELLTHFVEFPWKRQVAAHTALIEAHVLPTLLAEYPDRKIVLMAYEPDTFLFEYGQKKAFGTFIQMSVNHSEAQDLLQRLTQSTKDEFINYLKVLGSGKNDFEQGREFFLGSSKKSEYTPSRIKPAFDYRTSIVRTLGKLWINIGLIVGFSVLILINAPDNPDEVKSLIALAALALLALPGIVLAFVNYQKCRDFTISFQKHDNRFSITKGQEHIEFDKANIEKKVRVIPRVDFAMEASHYTRLIFKDGSELRLPELIISFYDLHMRTWHIETVKQKRFFPWLTSIFLPPTKKPG